MGYFILTRRAVKTDRNNVCLWRHSKGEASCRQFIQFAATGRTRLEPARNQYIDNTRDQRLGGHSCHRAGCLHASQATCNETEGFMAWPLVLIMVPVCFWTFSWSNLTETSVPLQLGQCYDQSNRTDQSKRLGIFFISWWTGWMC